MKILSDKEYARLRRADVDLMTTKPLVNHYKELNEECYRFFTSVCEKGEDWIYFCGEKIVAKLEPQQEVGQIMEILTQDEVDLMVVLDAGGRILTDDGKEEYVLSGKGKIALEEQENREEWE